jgi:CubicO group peptidase (beta-lactamase class C family)
MKAIFLLLVLAVVAGPYAPAQPPAMTRLDGSKITPAQIDATITRLMRAAEVTGVGVAIFEQGKISYLRTYGVRDQDKDLPLTEESVMTAASFTKVAFSYLVMQLVDSEKN